MHDMIEEPAFVQIDLANNTKITGRFVKYSDPEGAGTFGAFYAEDADGVKTYVLWAGIVRLTVYPLHIAPPEVTA